MPIPIHTIHLDDITFKQPGFPLGIFRNCKHPDYPLHCHDFDELVIIIRGTGINTVSKTNYPLRAGDVFLIPKGLAHAYSQMSNLYSFNIVFGLEQLHIKKWAAQSLPGFHALFTVEPSYRGRNGFNSRLRLTQKQLVHICGLAETLDQTLTEKLPGFRLIALARFLEIVAMLSRYYEKAPNNDTRKVLQIAKAISYMETHFSEETTTDTLASTAHMSPRNFHRVFLQATGETPATYLLRLRIMEAEHLLSHTDKAVTEIALDCGFTDSNYFARAFRRLTGHSPSSFRKEALASNRKSEPVSKTARNLS
jgi:AraC-like DNA-binding protein